MLYNNYHDTVLVVVLVLAVVAFFYMFYSAHQRKQARKHELSKQILEKMSSEEFLDLLKSQDGRRSIERLLGSYQSAGEWITDAIRRSVLLVFAGSAFVLVYRLTDFSGREIFLILGSLAVSIGVGYLFAAAITRARSANTDPAP